MPLSVSRRGIVIAEGDSWFHYPGRDVLAVLQDDFRWEVSSVAHFGDNLEDMAYAESQMADLCRQLEWIAQRDEVPSAVLLSGGGNDLAGPEFAMLLEHDKSSKPGLNSVISNELINVRLRDSLLYLVGAIQECSRETFGTGIPIYVHGYGHPVPDDRGFMGGWGPLPGPWLGPAFARKGVHKHDMDRRKEIARELIDEFNVMLSETASLPEAVDLNYVDVRTALDSGSDYRQSWSNELHPTDAGFREVARLLDEAITAQPN
ncbi:hypothetical protein AU196_20610 [Mycobacterium sp. IS-1742]|nr:hypothetical protein AU196_20610 [Mycobacterium sp. IS-1742]